MTQSAYKFGDFIFYAISQAEGIGPPSNYPVRNIDNFAAFLKNVKTPYLLAVAGRDRIKELNTGRLVQVARDTDAGMLYSDYFVEKDGKSTIQELNEYQQGSIRDDFNFGAVLLFSSTAVKSAVNRYGLLQNNHIALYDLRLKISIESAILHVPETLYTVSEIETRPPPINRAAAGPHFAYVAPDNFDRQKLLEKAATNYLKATGAHLKARAKTVPADEGNYPATASVVIPVFNRRKTIAAAIESALFQQTGFDYNIIVVDNHSTDGTGAIIKKLAVLHPEVVHHVPSRFDLAIGGCWNEAVLSPCCGRFAVQLDSDDLYSSPLTLQKIVDVLQKGKYAMVIGSYTIVDEHLQKIPPGLVDHREWTNANGHNNALRVNGLGAPRAFSTSVLRQIGFPDVGYGEDYAVALRITREYKIGRIYESLYLCRRWAENTDAALSPEKQNRNDFYKDKLRTIEIKARQMMNREGA
jgi:GT2 family glycosyltransferase